MSFRKPAVQIAAVLVSTALTVSAQFAPAPPYPNSPDGSNPGQVYQGPTPVDPNGPPPQNGDEVGGPIDVPDPADAQHGVARLSFLSGSVNVIRGAATGGTPVAAALNAPVTAQDHIQTGDRSSAEIQVNGADVLRLGQNGDLAFADLRAERFQAQLGSGMVIYSVLRPGLAQSEIDTPNIAFHALGQGSYRLTILSDGSTEISIRSGEAEILGPGGSQRLSTGHSYVVRGNADDPEFQEVEPQARDGFDDWSDARNAAEQNSRSAQYVGPDIPGTADLDTQGTWVPSPYGQAWTPSGVAEDWAPYSNGQWAYDGYYGWVWVDAAPWGWAPYHYGRWFHNPGYGWCWWPGPRVGLHIWSPALVGFVGFGGGYRGLGWVPLAPYERVRPWWGRNGNYFGGGRGYGYGNGLNSFRNAGLRGAVTFAAYNHFAGPGQHFDHLGREQLAGASVLAGRLPVTPSRGAYSFANRPAFGNIRVNPMASRSFASSQRFHQSFGSMNPAKGPNVFPSGNNRGSWSRLGASPPSRPQNQPQYRPVNPVMRPQSTSGWQRFGDPGANANRGFVPGNAPSGHIANGPPSSAYSEGGWHAFGQPSPPRSPSGSYPPQPGFSAPPRFSAPPPARYNGPSYGAPQYSGPRSPAPRYEVPRMETPRFSPPQAPPNNYRAPAPHASYSSPAPHYSGGGGGQASRSSSGGGSHSSGAGGRGHR